MSKEILKDDEWSNYKLQFSFMMDEEAEKNFMVEPEQDHFLVNLAKLPQKTESGIIIPESVKTQGTYIDDSGMLQQSTMKFGKVIKKSGTDIHNTGTLERTKVGDIVLFNMEMTTPVFDCLNVDKVFFVVRSSIIFGRIPHEKWTKYNKLNQK